MQTYLGDLEQSKCKLSVKCEVNGQPLIAARKRSVTRYLYAILTSFYLYFPLFLWCVKLFALCLCQPTKPTVHIKNVKILPGRTKGRFIYRFCPEKRPWDFRLQGFCCCTFLLK